MAKRSRGRYGFGAKASLAGAAILLSWPLVVGTPSGASAQGAGDLSSISQRLDRIERDIQTLSKIATRGGDAVPLATQSAGAGGSGALSGAAAARVGVRLDGLESDLRRVTGDIEQMTFEVRQLKDRLERLVADVDFRLTGLEQRIGAGAVAGSEASAAPSAPGTVSVGQTPQGTGAGKPTNAPAVIETLTEPGGTSPSGFARPTGTLGTVSAKAVEEVQGQTSAAAAAAGTPPAPPPLPGTAQPAGAQLSAVTRVPAEAPELTGTPEEQYRTAFGLIRQQNFDAAEVALNSFITRNEGHALVGNARYWLGETHYARDNFVDAAKIFLKGYETNPEGPKAPDSLLKLGMSLANLGEKEKACGAFEKLFADYPDLQSSLKRTAVRQQRTLSCP